LKAIKISVEDDFLFAEALIEARKNKSAQGQIA
jgi:hypothetical protein